jgi:hypothetical protein
MYVSVGVFIKREGKERDGTWRKGHNHDIAHCMGAARTMAYNSGADGVCGGGSSLSHPHGPADPMKRGSGALK